MRRALNSVIIVLLVGSGWVLPARGQSAPDAARQDPSENQEIRVFALQHIQVDQAARHVQLILGDRDTKIATDDRTNSLIVSATPAKLGQVEILLPQLDRPQEGGHERRTYFVELPAPASVQLLNAAEMALAGERSTIAAVDRTLVIVGEEADHQRVRELVAKTSSAAPPRSRPLQLTFYVLEASLDAKSGPKGDLPGGLKDVAQALAESGFYNARLRAPVVVYTSTDGQPFQVRGGTGADEVLVRGQVNELVGEMVLLTVQLDLRTMIRTPNAPSAEPGTGLQLETAAKARLGEYVALVASPTRAVDMPAAIVVLRVAPVGSAE